MKYGRVNLIAGALGLLMAGMGGMALGATFDKDSIRDGYHMLTVVRFYLREGHSHGMPLSLLNLIVGSYVDRLALSGRARRICSIAAILGFFLPLGLALNGAAGAPGYLLYLGEIGVAGIFTAAVLTVKGAWNLS